jgi:hypothetical protein
MEMTSSILILGGAGIAFFLTQTEKGEPFQRPLSFLPGFNFSGVFDCAFCSGFWSGVYLRLGLCVLSILSGELQVTSPLMGGVHALLEMGLYGMSTGILAITLSKVHDLADGVIHIAAMMTSFIPEGGEPIVESVDPETDPQPGPE